MVALRLPCTTAHNGVVLLRRISGLVAVGDGGRRGFEADCGPPQCEREAHAAIGRGFDRAAGGGESCLGCLKRTLWDREPLPIRSSLKPGSQNLVLWDNGRPIPKGTPLLYTPSLSHPFRCELWNDPFSYTDDSFNVQDYKGRTCCGEFYHFQTAPPVVTRQERSGAQERASDEWQLWRTTVPVVMCVRGKTTGGPSCLCKLVSSEENQNNAMAEAQRGLASSHLHHQRPSWLRFDLALGGKARLKH